MTLYTDKVLAIQLGNLIGYWQLSESGGLTAIDVSGQANHGVYSNVTLGQPGIGDGGTSALFVPASSSYTGVWSAGFDSDFNDAAGTLMCWIKVSGAGVWTDGTARAAINLGVNETNRITILKSTVNGRLQLSYVAGGTYTERFIDSLTSTNWIRLAITWSVAADEVKAYMSGIQQGATLNGLGA